MWRLELAKSIKDSRSGVFCLTQENQKSLWLAFECGALSTTAQSGRIIPFLIDVESEGLGDPFSIFQALPADQKGVRRLLQALIREDFGNTVEEQRLFRAFWPLLEAVLLASDPQGVESCLNALEDVANTRRQIKLCEVTFEPKEVERGGTIEIEYVIDAPVSGVKAWLGASVEVKRGDFKFEKPQDRVIQLRSGEQRCARELTIPSDAATGSWDLKADVWYGPLSDSDNSYPIARIWPLEEKLTII
jgi:hypothetical protein